MHGLLHFVGAVVVVPYLALAWFFIFIGKLAGTKGLFALIEVIWNEIDRTLGWGIYLAPLLWICLVGAGFIPRLQRASSICLCVLALVSLLVIVLLSSTRIGLGELIFLLPCLAVVAISAWLALRVVNLAQPI